MKRFKFGRPSRASRSQQVRRSGKFKLLPLGVFLVFAIYYVATNQNTVPVTGRTQLVDISREQETALGLSSYSQILSKSTVLSSGPEVERVRRIGNRLAEVTGQEGVDWEFNLIQSDQVNAFCLPGGKVAVFTGILPVAQNDDGLAAVMGHEIAHAIARHGAERLAHQRLAQIGSIAVAASASDMDPTVQRVIVGAFGVGSQFGVHLPFSREHESEADYIGLLYLARACFDPSEAPRFWERMNRAAGKNSQIELLSTHPLPETRVRELQKWLPEAKRVYQENCGER